MILGATDRAATPWQKITLCCFILVLLVAGCSSFEPTRDEVEGDSQPVGISVTEVEADSQPEGDSVAEAEGDSQAGGVSVAEAEGESQPEGESVAEAEGNSQPEGDSVAKVEGDPVSVSAAVGCRDHDSILREPKELRQYPSNLGASCYAWQLFSALNFPASSDATGPVETQDEGPTRWESWESVDEVFAPGDIEAACPSLSLSAEVVSMTKGISPRAERSVADVLDINCLDHSVVDPWGQSTWSEVSIDPELVNFLRELIELDGGRVKARDGKSLDTIEMPPQEDNLNASPSMTIKASWARLGKIDDPEWQQKYYVRNMVTFDDEQRTCSLEIPMALVGLHIAQKTRHHQGWIWMTFEHERNAPLASNEEQMGQKWNFYHPDGVKWWRYEGVPWATQLVRLHKPDPSAQQANDYWHQALGENSVWRNYMLVGVQWGDRDPAIAGVRDLSNSVLEPWCQRREDGCIGCHEESDHDRSFVLDHLDDSDPRTDEDGADEFAALRSH